MKLTKAQQATQSNLEYAKKHMSDYGPYVVIDTIDGKIKFITHTLENAIEEVSTATHAIFDLNQFF